MAWRPYENLVGGYLDNTVPGKVTGELYFIGLPEPVSLSLDGDFHRDIRGCKVLLSNPEPANRDVGRDENYMDGFEPNQTGTVGDMTAGLPPHDYGESPYFEWYADNGRIVLELEPEQVEIIGTPDTDGPRLDPAEQHAKFQHFMESMLASLAKNTGRSAVVVTSERSSLGIGILNEK